MNQIIISLLCIIIAIP